MLVGSALERQQTNSSLKVYNSSSGRTATCAYTCFRHKNVVPQCIPRDMRYTRRNYGSSKNFEETGSVGPFDLIYKSSSTPFTMRCRGGTRFLLSNLVFYLFIDTEQRITNVNWRSAVNRRYHPLDSFVCRARQIIVHGVVCEHWFQRDGRAC